METITCELLVQIVSHLATTSVPLVEAAAIIAYCNANQIDLQGAGHANYAAFWESDLAEAVGAHRLQKFKRSTTAQARNAWCLFSSLAAGREWGSENGWLLVPWSPSEQNWMFQIAGPAMTTDPYV
jgi:hypothetical protein